MWGTVKAAKQIVCLRIKEIKESYFDDKYNVFVFFVNVTFNLDNRLFVRKKFLSPPEVSGLSEGKGDEMGKFLSPPEVSGLSEGKGDEMGKC